MTATLDICSNQAAEQLTGRDYISWSSINTYLSCPLRYAFMYVEGLPEKMVSASLVFGGAIHAALELHFNEIMAGNPPPSVDDLLGAYHDAWHDRDMATIRFAKTDDAESLDRLAENMLRAFYGSDFAKPTGTILAVEEELRGPVIPGCPDVLARLDLVVDNGRELLVADFKTSRSAWSQAHVEDAAGQLLLYSELARTLADGKPLRLQFAVLTKTKTPDLALHDVVASQQQIERTTRMVERVWQAIERGLFYPAPSPMTCPTCAFREPCRAWTG